MKQVYHHYEKWEDFKNGMWRKESKEYEESTLKNVVQFTGDHSLYGNAMLRVTLEWPITCEHNLTNKSINRKAWLGHAACCIEKNFPEYLVRQAWGMLAEEQRVKANQAADSAIKKWEYNHSLKDYKIIQLAIWNNE